MTPEEHLDPASRERLAELRADFEKETGRPFDSFYCPILYRDDDAPLCKGHIVNQSIRGASRKWTIQRKDVDNFYGSLVEADFALLQERGNVGPYEVLSNSKLNRLLAPKVLVDGEEVGHFKPSGPVPKRFSKIDLEKGEKQVDLALKLEPSELLERLDSNWEVTVEKDLRLAALITMLKAAHLTLFSLLGYNYALSAGGHYLGWDVLGSFYSAHGDKSRIEQLAAADLHFREFVNMVRPMEVVPDGFEGSVNDGRIWFCGAGDPWAILVFVKAGDDSAAILVPVFEKVRSSVHFLEFIDSPSGELPVRIGEFKGDHFEVSKRIDRLIWPDARFDDPLEHQRGE